VLSATSTALGGAAARPLAASLSRAGKSPSSRALHRGPGTRLAVQTLAQSVCRDSPDIAFPTVRSRWWVFAGDVEKRWNKRFAEARPRRDPARPRRTSQQERRSSIDRHHHISVSLALLPGRMAILTLAGPVLCAPPPRPCAQLAASFFIIAAVQRLRWRRARTEFSKKAPALDNNSILRSALGTAAGRSLPLRLREGSIC